MKAEEELVGQEWMATCSWSFLVPTFPVHARQSICILWWIAPRPAWPYDLVGWTEPRLSWAVLATWSLSVPRSGTPSQPGPSACQELFFFNGISLSAADGMALFQNPRGLHCDSPIGLAINSTWHLFPPQIPLITEGLLVIWSKKQGCL